MACALAMKAHDSSSINCLYSLAFSLSKRARYSASTMTIKTLTAAQIRKVEAALAKSKITAVDAATANKAMKLALRRRCSTLFVAARSRWRIIALLIALIGDAAAETALPAHLSPIVRAGARLTVWSASLTALTNLYYAVKGALREWHYRRQRADLRRRLHARR